MTRSPWIIWLVLTALAWVSIALLVLYAPWRDLAPRPGWLLTLQFTIFPLVGLAALGAPIIAAVLLFLGRWVLPTLATLAVVAVAQALVVIVEFAGAAMAKDREFFYQDIRKT